MCLIVALGTRLSAAVTSPVIFLVALSTLDGWQYLLSASLLVKLSGCQVGYRECCWTVWARLSLESPSVPVKKRPSKQPGSSRVLRLSAFALPLAKSLVCQ